MHNYCKAFLDCLLAGGRVKIGVFFGNYSKGVLKFVSCLQIILFSNIRSAVHFYGWRG